MDWRERLREMTGQVDDETLQWHAVYVMTGDEDNVRQKIDYAFKGGAVRAIVPKRSIRERKEGHWHERTKPLFPGYILLQGSFDTEDYHVLKAVPGVVRILRDSQGRLTPIHPGEIEIISKLMSNGELIGTSEAIQDGDAVIIKSGPLYGLEGLITAIDRRKGRARVKLSILGDERTVDLSITFIGARET